jgi:hypothetical protein
MRALERQSARRRVYSLTALGGIVVLGVVAIFTLLSATKRETKKTYLDPVGALREIARQEMIFHLHQGRYAPLAELVREGAVIDELLQGPFEGFRYSDVTVAKDHFVIAADPVGALPPPRPGVTGGATRPPDPPRVPPVPRHYCVDETHTIRGDVNPITTRSPVVWSPRDSWAR